MQADEKPISAHGNERTESQGMVLQLKSECHQIYRSTNKHSQQLPAEDRALRLLILSRVPRSTLNFPLPCNPIPREGAQIHKPVKTTLLLKSTLENLSVWITIRAPGHAGPISLTDTPANRAPREFDRPSIAMTMRYSHLAPSHIQQAVEKLVPIPSAQRKRD